MRIDKIELTNFRCFEKFTLELHPQFTLLVGENGAGKSSLLHALRIAMCGWGIFFNLNKFNEAFLLSDVRKISVYRGVYQDPQSIYPSEIRAAGYIQQPEDRVENITTWVVQRNKNNGQINWAIQNLQKIFESIQEQLKSKNKTILPLLAFYSTARAVTALTTKSIENPSAIEKTYQHLASGDLPQLDLVTWMKWREETRLQSVSGALDKASLDRVLKASLANDMITVQNYLKAASASAESPELEAVSTAVCACLGGVSKFFFHLDSQQLRVEFLDGRVISYDMLSDGQRSIISLVATLAWQAYHTNPRHGANAAKEAVGVVLIDELDLHLHPKWQREIIENLTKVFPKIQFVATTHSPQVISTAQPEWLRVIAPGQTEALRVDAVHGRDSNAILREVMGVSERPAWMEQKLDQLNSLIEDEKLEEARTLLEELRTYLGSHDQTLMGLAWELKDAESSHAKD